MKGSHQVRVRNSQISYKFTIVRNITVLRGDSATGKTTLIDMIASYQREGINSGIELECDKKCVVLDSYNWKMNLSLIKDSIVFIDEGVEFVEGDEFAREIKKSDNYYVIATRNNLFNLPYSIKEIYGIRNKSGNRYQGTKRLYSEFYPLYREDKGQMSDLESVIVEDSNSGYEFFKGIFENRKIKVISAKGKSNIYSELLKSDDDLVLIIADGAAFGSEIERILSLRKRKKVLVYLPESFEWLILNADLIKDKEVKDVLENTSNYVDSRDYFSWERFFYSYLVEKTKGTYLQYSKESLNIVYLQEKERNAIISKMPEVNFETI